jgi:RND superfamily putative drug exporter
VGRTKRSGGWFRRVLGVALRHPVAVAAAATVALVTLALPALGLQLRNEGVDDLPQDSPVIATYHRLTDAFPGGQTPARVVVRAADVTTPQMRAALARLRTEALATGQMYDPVDVRVSTDHTVAAISIPLSGGGEDKKSVTALKQLHDLLPGTVGSVAGSTVKLSGPTAESVAFKDLMRHRTPVVFGFVLLVAFLLLLMSFRSVVVAATAIVLNLLGVAASYGALVLVFQHGVGSSLIGLHATGAIVNWVPLFLFVILFGLSMDYHVLIVSRITEARAQRRGTREAIAEGIGSSAGVVTSAALIMVFVFLCFVGLSMTSMKQVGLGLAIAVFLDATVIRVLLLPAVMTLLGERNWYLPRWLGWVPELRHEHTGRTFDQQVATAPDPAEAHPAREPERV